jgi:predicted ATP-grasp superfamily ATP-dependent carboligase
VVETKPAGKLRNPLKRPVLILGWIPRIVLPIARSLHRHGIPVDVADCVDAPRIASRSRSVRKFVRIPYPPYGIDAFVTKLRHFVVQYGHDMLIPADDTALAATIERYDDFKDLVQIACPPPGITRLVLNKAATLEIALRCGIRVPRTVIVSNSGQLFEHIDSFPFPWVLKPMEKESRLQKVNSHLLATASDVTLKFSTPSKFAPPMLLQEYCEGVGVGVEMLMHRGKCLAVFQHRRLKELPYTGGVSVTAVAEHPNPALVESSLALLRALQWEGIAMVEFKVDRDGSAVLMEVNGRYWGTLSLPVSAGIDFPLYHWQLLHGEEPKIPQTYSAGTRWRWTVGCLDRIHRLFAEAKYSPGTRKVLDHELLRLSEDFSPRVHDATFKISDPLPSMAALFHAVRYFIFPVSATPEGWFGSVKLRERS